MKTSAGAGPDISDQGEILRHLSGMPRYRNTALRSAWSRLRFFMSVVRCRLQNRAEPLFVVLVTNNKCNLACRYCYGAYGDRDHYEEFSTGKLIEIMDDLWDLGTRNLTIHGGESLLRPDIGELLNYAKLKGFYVSLNTNGILVPHKIDQLKCVDTICVSLDGAEESHDRNRGRGSYRQAMRAMEIILQNSIPLVVHATLTRHNVGDLDFLARTGAAMGFRVQFSILYTQGGLPSEDVLTDGEIRDVMKRILQLRRGGYPIYYSEGVLDSVIHWPLQLDRHSFIKESEWGGNPEYDHHIDCYHGTLKYQIDADGRVVTCWGHDDADAPNVKTLGVAAAIRECGARKDCRHCTFLANNEHNLMFSLNPRALVDLAVLQISDAFKHKKKGARAG